MTWSPSCAVLHSLYLLPLLPSRTNHQAWDIIPSWSEFWSTSHLQKASSQEPYTLVEINKSKPGSATVKTEAEKQWRRWYRERPHWWGRNKTNIWCNEVGSIDVCKNNSGNSSEPRAGLENLRSSEKSRKGPVCERYFVLFLQAFFCWGLGNHCFSVFLRWVRTVMLYRNPGIWSRPSPLFRKYKWIQKSNTCQFFIGAAWDVSF